MKLFATLIFLVMGCICKSQHYYRGEIIDEKNKLIPNCVIYMHSSKINFNAGSGGSFGLMSTKSKVDTFTVKSEGYEVLTVPVYADKLNILKLKMLAEVANLQKNRLASVTKDLITKQRQGFFSSNETYSDLIENNFINAKQYPITGFSVNSDRASYSNIRRFINMKGHVPTNAVRIDEMINYFNFDFTKNDGKNTFQVSSQLTQSPWNKNNFLLFVNVVAKKIDLEKIPPSNLVFLIDNSGSMELQNRLPLLKSAFKLLVKNLREKDKVTLITYGGSVDVALEATSGLYKDSIIKAIDEMQAGGETPGASAINLAYNKAKESFVKNGNNRVILATDGDFNVGIADENELQKLISLQSQTGIYLTCLGVGMGNYKDSKLQILAKKGNGNFAYIDNETEGEKVLVQEMTQTLFSVADNTFMNIKFNSNIINEYRLIGFDNKKNSIVDTSSKLEGGQVGSGYSTLILFEIKPNGTFNLDKTDALLQNVIAQLQINYDNPQTKKSEKIDYSCKFNFLPLLSLPKYFGFAASVAMYGEYLKKSEHLNDATLEQIKELANETYDKNSVLQKEFLQLVLKSFPIYEAGKKKKKK